MIILSFATDEPAQGSFIIGDDLVVGATREECVEYLASIGYAHAYESTKIIDGIERIAMTGAKET